MAQKRPHPGAAPNERRFTMDVVCLGILIADIFASPIDSLPEAGELRLIEGYLVSAGGCAANTAACLRLLHIRTDRRSRS